MAYSVDFRKRAIAYWDKGHTKEELYEAFGIHPSRVHVWKRLLRETGALKPQYRETRERKINLAELERAIERKPDATLAELAKQFDCTYQAVDAACKRAKITRKKRHSLTKKKTV
jgi:transposase